MENVQVEIKGNTLVITIDGSKDLGMSTSGKTRLVASTKGNQKFQVGARQVFLGINVYTK